MQVFEILDGVGWHGIHIARHYDTTLWRKGSSTSQPRVSRKAS